LNDQSHYRGCKPEKGKIMQVCTKGGKDTADIGILQGKSKLHPEKSKAKVPYLPVR